MELKNVINYYLGCQVRLTTNIEGNEVIETLTPALLQDIYDTIEDWGVIPDDKKPLIMLHSLEDMTEEDANECWKLLGWNEQIKPAHRAEDLVRELTTDELDSNWPALLKIMPYLLKQSYDLFSLLESGQAKRILK